jgi:HEPN domain-containing protein
MKEPTREWLMLAEYDFETAKAMHKTGRYNYVWFTCQQTLEKALKAVIAEKLEDGFPPRVHNLIDLARKAGISGGLTPKQDLLLDELSGLYATSRYPDATGFTLPSDKQQTERILSRTGDLLAWIKKQLYR